MHILFTPWVSQGIIKLITVFIYKNLKTNGLLKKMKDKNIIMKNIYVLYFGVKSLFLIWFNYLIYLYNLIFCFLLVFIGVALKCWVSFCCTSKRIIIWIYIYICHVTREHWGELPMIHSKFSLVIYFIHNSHDMESN